MRLLHCHHAGHRPTLEPMPILEELMEGVLIRLPAHTKTMMAIVLIAGIRLTLEPVPIRHPAQRKTTLMTIFLIAGIRQTLEPVSIRLPARMNMTVMDTFHVVRFRPTPGLPTHGVCKVIII